jgi:hypothetical protein
VVAWGPRGNDDGIIRAGRTHWKVPRCVWVLFRPC